MKRTYFAEFYVLRDNQFVEATGSDGVVYLDGRLRLTTMMMRARLEGKERGYDGYRIARGTHTQPFYLTAGVLPV